MAEALRNPQPVPRDNLLLQFLTPQRLWSQPPVLRYGLAVVIVVAATALRWVLIPWLGSVVPQSVAIPVIAVATVVLGFGPGLLWLALVVPADEEVSL